MSRPSPKPAAAAPSARPPEPSAGRPPADQGHAPRLADDLGMVLASEETSHAAHSPARVTLVGKASPLAPRPAGEGLLPLGVSRDFGAYELIGEIGRGGMGVVYKARQKELDRVVAVKMILSSHLATPEQVERFYAEARASARLRHPFIVSIHEVGETHGQHYFAMEYIPGPSLADLLEEGPLDPTAAAECVRLVATTVDHLHAQGVIHRDLKPSNILLDEEGRPYVSDFGLAKMLTGEGAKFQSGALVGTPSYMAPEQATGRAAAADARSDVYSLGAILYECLTGKPPFDGDGPMEILVQVLEREPIRPARLRPDVPRALERICLKCLEKAPDARYASAAALAEDLGRFLAGEPTEVRREGPWHWLRRWARQEPALASRLGTMGICGAIIQTNYYLLDSHEALAHDKSIGLVFVWALASMIFQVLLRNERWASLARYLWAAADVGLFSALVVVNNGLATAQVSGYFLLVAASGLWFRERLVWFTTAMAVAAYGGLVCWEAYEIHALPGSTHHVILAAVLAVSGVIIAHQVRRVRVLSHYYEHRPLA